MRRTATWSAGARAVPGRRDQPGGRQIGTEIGQGRDAQGEEVARLIERHLGMRDIVAALIIGEERLAALADPAPWTAEPPSRPQHEDIFGVDGVLEAEAAADIADEDADA